MKQILFTALLLTACAENQTTSNFSATPDEVTPANVKEHITYAENLFKEHGITFKIDPELTDEAGLVKLMNEMRLKSSTAYLDKFLEMQKIKDKSLGSPRGHEVEIIVGNDLLSQRYGSRTSTKLPKIRVRLCGHSEHAIWKERGKLTYLWAVSNTKDYMKKLNDLNLDNNMFYRGLSVIDDRVFYKRSPAKFSVFVAKFDGVVKGIAMAKNVESVAFGSRDAEPVAGTKQYELNALELGLGSLDEFSVKGYVTDAIKPNLKPRALGDQ